MIHYFYSLNTAPIDVWSLVGVLPNFMTATCDAHTENRLNVKKQQLFNELKYLQYFVGVDVLEEMFEWKLCFVTYL